MMSTYPEPRSGEAPVLHLELDVTPEAPSLARAAITGFSEHRRLKPGMLALLTLLVSEVVTNAIVHAPVKPLAKIRLSARMSEGVIRVEVTDPGTGFTPVARDPARSDGGYGLYLLERQTSRWGVEQRDGTNVWFELASSEPHDE